MAGHCGGHWRKLSDRCVLGRARRLQQRGQARTLKDVGKRGSLARDHSSEIDLLNRSLTCKMTYLGAILGPVGPSPVVPGVAGLVWSRISAALAGNLLEPLLARCFTIDMGTFFLRRVALVRLPLSAIFEHTSTATATPTPNSHIERHATPSPLYVRPAF